MAGENKPKGLFDLPTELWLDIGKKVIDEEDMIGNTTFFRKIVPPEPAIFNASDRLRAALEAYYYTTKTDILYSWRIAKFFNQWAHSIGAENLTLCNIEVVVWTKQAWEQEEQLRRSLFKTWGVEVDLEALETFGNPAWHTDEIGPGPIARRFRCVFK
ncbi:Hypothetical predicted protein [Lecanosticta acicola]|uniref:Uncharacterized protein n=1 Tax=Lecanosticta acicola TaxID=111012 RepID=A0AAI8YX02_9PEZI|nr:Hypothetical predicted protein [Lecanosticta acicola]